MKHFKELKTVTISGIDVLATMDDQIMIARSIPGKIDLFFRPYNFCLNADELSSKLTEINRELHALMTCNLENKGRGIINLEYNPFITSSETVDQFINRVILYLYEYKVDDDEFDDCK